MHVGDQMCIEKCVRYPVTKIFWVDLLVVVFFPEQTDVKMFKSRSINVGRDTSPWKNINGVREIFIHRF